MNVAALVSGGVDSSVVVHLLKEQGITPDIFYIRIGMEDEEGYIDCPAEEDIEITTFIARKYGCRFQEVNLHKEYWDNVVSYTIESVRKGLTPNPDVMCNKLIKFGAFEQRCGKDYDRTATGHYAQTECLNVSNTLSVDKLISLYGSQHINISTYQQNTFKPSSIHSSVVIYSIVLRSFSLSFPFHKGKNEGNISKNDMTKNGATSSPKGSLRNDRENMRHYRNGGVRWRKVV